MAEFFPYNNKLCVGVFDDLSHLSGGVLGAGFGRKTMNDKKLKYSFEEFKLMYESAEKVTGRRLQTNRWNYTICVAVLVAIAGVIKYSVGNMSFFYIGLVSVLVLSGIAILFCCLWVGQIRDFKSLNHAKFDVLNQMAQNVEYDPNHPGMITPFCSFEKEWNKLQEVKALQEEGKTNFIALKSTNIEYYIPKAFIAVFACIIIVTCIFILPKRSTYFKLQSNVSTNKVTETQQINQ